MSKKLKRIYRLNFLADQCGGETGFTVFILFFYLRWKLSQDLRDLTVCVAPRLVIVFKFSSQTMLSDCCQWDDTLELLGEDLM